ncbi:MAG: VCBS repeat-containing protein, partial [Ginsengibacter sp.]
MDAFIGSYDGRLRYYKNTGSALTPIFTLQTGSANPLDVMFPVFSNVAPAFVDIDGDGDMDAFIGSYEAYNGAISYYKNTGTASAPVFAQQSGAANPFVVANVGDYPIPTFLDIDGDGDMDAFIGELYGEIIYYKNTGTRSAPVFTLQTGAADPFDGVAVSDFSAPAFVDIDGDGDIDAFIGAGDGTISYYKNTTTVTPCNWSGAVNNNWENPDNWSCGFVPGPNADVILSVCKKTLL